MNNRQLRKKFLQYFILRGHKEISPSSLVPENDPSVLFTTAGMQQFKRFYLFPEEAKEKNVVTIQPCFRTSDIDLVGDESHLTFFEMLGNFSFGGYSKKEAIDWAYEFLTKEVNIDRNRIWCSIFAGDNQNPKDEESFRILKDMGIRFKECGREDNFWGPTGSEGPCGPTVEFYIDGFEVWNLVFNQYYKTRDGRYESLKTPGIDTGMGLERMLAVLNGVRDIYETDVFSSVISKIEEISQKKYQNFSKEFRIIADHLKAVVFAINDNVLPSNKERGYVIRRLIRRAIFKGWQLGISEHFTSGLASEILEIYKGIYDFQKKNILTEIEKEETKFRKTLSQGLRKIELYSKTSSQKPVTGKIIFDWYQTYGIPPEVSLEEIERFGINLKNNKDKILKEFQNHLFAHQQLSRTASAGMFKGGLVNHSEKAIKYHTATHLLLKALQEILGSDVHQRGSNITEERLRFDFSYSKKMTEEQIKKVEDLVNQKIKANLPVKMEEMTIEEAKKRGAEAQFTSKYGDRVKVYSIGNYSIEVCGGPHVKRTGEIGRFKIIKEESSGAGIRRIKARVE